MAPKIGSMLSDIVGSLFTKPATENYPNVPSKAPLNTRGKVVYDESTCTGCRLCVRDCPAEAIDILILDRKAKRFVMHYMADRCIFCGQCVESCRFDSIHLSDKDWELAAISQSQFDIYYGTEEDVNEVLGKHAATVDTGAE
ncbi:MAG: 4Fe-4S binding protein [Anaerolineaceae bacterium]|nr:4Fe-4S binding protein [Anaerolineaceae bacterium]